MMSAASPTHSPGSPGKDPLRDLIERMEQHRHALAAHDPRLSQQIEALAMSSHDAAAQGDATFRTRVAYVYQDFTRLAGPAAGMPEPLRAELEHLARTAPGLTNQRIHDMLREAPNLNDSRLTGEIRRLAVEVGRDGGDQNRPHVLDRVESLERKLALLGTPHVPSRSAAGIPARQSNDVSQVPTTVLPSKPEDWVQLARSPGEGPHPSATAAPSAGSPPASGVPPRSPEARAPAAASPSASRESVPASRSGGVLGRAIVMMAEPRPDARPPWERPPTPIGERIERLLGRFGDNATLEVAEKSGQKAVEALRGFSQGAGASVMALIHEAARADPQGIQGVLSEMREGGRHAELRTQFNNAMAQEKRVAAAYGTAAEAVKQYGTDRQAAEAVLLKRSDPGALAGRFERLDAQIGEAAAQVPSRQEGKTVMEELGQRVATLVRQATEAVRSVLQSENRASATASSSLSPSP